MAVSPEGAVPFMRHYEMMIILDPGLEETTVQPSLEQFLTVVKTGGGSVDKVDVWGRRRLAYEIAKKPEGVYHLIVFEANAETLDEISRVLKIDDGVLRHLATKHIEGSRTSAPRDEPPAPAAPVYAEPVPVAVAAPEYDEPDASPDAEQEEE